MGGCECVFVRKNGLYDIKTKELFSGKKATVRKIK